MVLIDEVLKEGNKSACCINTPGHLDALHCSADPFVGLTQGQAIGKASAARPFLLIDVVGSVLLLQEDVALLSVFSRKAKHGVEAVKG